MAKLQAVEKKDGVLRNDLLKVLEKVRVAVDTREMTGHVQAQHFLIDNDHVSAFDDQISISSPLGIETGLRCTVFAEDLFAVLDKITEEWVVLKQGDDGDLSITSSTSRFGLSTLPLEGELVELMYQLSKEIKPNNWQELPEGFTAALKLCGFSVSKNVVNMAYSSIYVDCDGMSPGAMYSTDAWRISRYTFDDAPAMTFLLPYDSAEELCKYAVKKVQIVGPWVHFQDDDGLIFSARHRVADFPDCDPLFEVKGMKVDLPKEIAIALDKTLVFAPGEDPDAREAELYFRNGSVMIRTQHVRGWGEQDVQVPTMKVPEMPYLRINPLFLIDILKHAATMTVGKKSALFSSKNFEHLMVLPSMSEPAEE